MTTKSLLISFLLFLIVLAFSATQVFAQNKLGINIAARHQEFDQAANMVGQGGWIVILASPGNANELKPILTSHPEVNIILRGHCPSDPLGPDTEQNRKFALSWVATLGELDTAGRKIFFMPWNEPNMTRECQGTGDDFDPNNTACAPFVKNYISDLKNYLSAAGLLGTKVELLSPMINQHHPNYHSFINALGGRPFFDQFYGISMNLYDNESCGSPLCHNEAFRNAGKFNETLNEVGLGGLRIFAVETGLVSPQGAITDYPSFNDADMSRFISNAYPLWSSAGNFIMFSPLSYNPETNDDSWIYGGNTQNFYNSHKSAGNVFNSSTPAGFLSWRNAQGLVTCGAGSSTFILPGGHCDPCGGGFSLQTCIPIPGNNSADEYGRKAGLDLKEKATYSKNDESCLEGIIEGKIDIDDMRIPLVKGLNNYFLGDSAKDSFVSKNTTADPFKNAGAFRLLAPKEYQDELKIKFLDEIASRGRESKYAFLKIKGMKPIQIKDKFIRIQNKSSGQRSSEDLEFLSQVWSLIPLFANEESEGHLFLERGPADLDVSAVRTSVPEVYRLNNVSNFMAAMLVPGFKDRSQASLPQSNQNLAQTDGNKVLQASDEICPITLAEEKINAKKALSGPGETVCTNIKGEENKLLKTRGINNDAEESCSAGGCEFDPQTQKESDVLNRCCGNQGKCLKNQDGGFYCEERGCGSCWGATTSRGCCVSASAPKTVTFTDSKLNLKNRVPYLAGIEENLIGKKGQGGGLFKIFLPSSDTSQNIFEDVAGEAENININIKDIQTRLKKGRNARFEAKPTPAQTGVLFYKLGTFQIVKNFIGKLLSP